MLSLALALCLASNPQTMAGGRGGVLVPAPIFRLLTSDPAAECNGAALTSSEGTSITHTNATTTRYCVKADGSLAAVTANQPRVSNKGILVEGGRTNFTIRSVEFDTWTAGGGLGTTISPNTTDPAGGTQADRVDSSVGGGNGNEYLQSAAFVPSQTTGTASVWMQNSNDGEVGQLVVRDTTAGVDRATCTGFALSSTWTRFSCNATGLTGANNHVLRVFPGSVGATLSVDGVILWMGQFEAPLANFRTSEIPTAGASASRSNDVYTWSNATDISAAGCLSATVTFGQSAQFGGSILANGTEQMMATTDSTHVKINDGTNTVTAAVSDLTGRTVNILTKWTGTTMTVIADGVTATGTFDGAFSSTATMRIGATAAASGFCNCWVDNIKAGANPEACN